MYNLFELRAYYNRGDNMSKNSKSNNNNNKNIRNSNNNNNNNNSRNNSIDKNSIDKNSQNDDEGVGCIQDEYDLLKNSTVSSANDCTGLIPEGDNIDDEQLGNYESVYPFSAPSIDR